MPLWGNEERVTPIQINNLIKSLERENNNVKRNEERERKAEERERKAEEREHKAEERKQLMLRQMEVQQNLTTSIQDLIGKIDELENIIRNQSGSSNPAQNNSLSEGIVEGGGLV